MAPRPTIDQSVAPGSIAGERLLVETGPWVSSVRGRGDHHVISHARPLMQGVSCPAPDRNSASSRACRAIPATCIPTALRQPRDFAPDSSLARPSRAALIRPSRYRDAANDARALQFARLPMVSLANSQHCAQHILRHATRRKSFGVGNRAMSLSTRAGDTSASRPALRSHAPTANFGCAAGLATLQAKTGAKIGDSTSTSPRAAPHASPPRR